MEESMTQEEALALAEEIKPRLPAGWEIAEVRRLWCYDEWRIDLLSETSGYIVHSRAAWQMFLEKYDLVPCQACGHPFHRNTFICDQCGTTRF